MNYENKVLDIVRRTNENLVATDRWRAGDPSTPFHEVTNLVNSLLGLIVVPKEEILGYMRQVEVRPHGISDWGVAFELVQVEGSLPRELRPFLTGLRNAIAHAGLDFPSDGTSITGITFANRTNDKARILWTAKFNLEGMRCFLAPLTKEVERACRARLRSFR
jgi:hypothetical protein